MSILASAPGVSALSGLAGLLPMIP
jgi:hypothetical protein